MKALREYQLSQNDSVENKKDPVINGFLRVPGQTACIDGITISYMMTMRQNRMFKKC